MILLHPEERLDVGRTAGVIGRCCTHCSKKKLKYFYLTAAVSYSDSGCTISSIRFSGDTFLLSDST